MAKFDPAKSRKAVTFHCLPCKRTFSTDPARVDDAPEQTWHPFRYFAPCPDCGRESEQAPYDRALQKAWVSATGPKTEEGKAATAKNLEGHPTPEEATRTRFNAMKHGLNAKVADYFPAKPDGYAFCKGCAIDRDYCRAQPACEKQTKLFMLHKAAFEQRDPKKLMGVYSELQAAVFAVLQQVLQTIIADGVKITSPEYYTDKYGVLIIAQYFDAEAGQTKTLTNIEAHPLFRPLGDLLSRTGLTLADMGMTTKVIEVQQEDMGQLAGEKIEREHLGDYQAKQLQLLQGLKEAVERGQKKTNNDPVLLEYNQQTGEATQVRAPAAGA